MSQYVLTRSARADVEEIHDFIALDSPGAAAKVRVALEQAIKKLARHPQMGHLRHDLADETLRFWPIYSYLIVYRSVVTPLEIVRILHASRDVRHLLESESTD